MSSNQKETKNGYFVGLDVDTGAVGYAVTDRDYSILKYRGEPMWGVQLFDKAELCEDRRKFRSNRRRLGRVKQRISLLRELFAPEISKVDPDFYTRLNSSALYAEDKDGKYSLFNDKDYTDVEYNKQYPSVHHLILDLMDNPEKHDARLVYLACAWLIANRGHFFSDISMENIGDITDFRRVYSDMTDMLLRRSDDVVSIPWTLDNIDDLGEILKKKTGVTKKYKEIVGLLFDSNSPKTIEGFYLNLEVFFKALCGGKIAAKDLFENDEYAEIESFTLDSDDEKIAIIMSQLGDDADVVRVLKAVYDWSLLATVLNGSIKISEAKVKIYEQHKEDLKFLKYFIRKYAKDCYWAVFRSCEKNNYVSYSYHSDDQDVEKTDKEEFSKYIEKIVKDIEPDEQDREKYDDMIARLSTRTFMPKQKGTENRTIPHQLYQYELQKILENAEKYIPSFAQKDDTGFTVSEKIVSIFTFRVPYYVGPLNEHSPFAWIKRKADGKIYPWNFSELVDEGTSEQEFIRRMIGRCTYIPYAYVLPKHSLLYHKYNVLNEINTIRIDGHKISTEAKQAVYNDLFMKKRKVTFKALKEYLISNHYAEKKSLINGCDINIKSDLKPYLDFAKIRESGTLTDSQIEDVIMHRTCMEDKIRFMKWLTDAYPHLSDADCKYISNLKYKEFGRLSRMLLEDIPGTRKKSETGEAFSIIDALWNTSNNLMELLSDSYTYSNTLEEMEKEYYSEHPESLYDRLTGMYLSNTVKRPVIRALDITQEIVKAQGSAPDRIFIRVTRGNNQEQNNDTPPSRRALILEIYKKSEDDNVPELKNQLERLGEGAETRLQSEKLYLYFMQFGRCAYSGIKIDIMDLSSDAYNIDHIYPKAYAKEDSLNNKVLVCSEINGDKDNIYPINADIQAKMMPTWEQWRKLGAISEEKYKRLVRTTEFTEEEKIGFINRQIVDVSQSTKAIAKILKERYPDTEIVYVKGRLTSEFRQEYDLLRSRVFNDLYYAKDAYLNIVVGNVYHMKFTRRWFDPSKEYSINTNAAFGREVCYSCGERYWNGAKSIEKIKKNLVKNNAHYTKYAFCRHGGFYDQMPLKKAPGLVPLKAGLPTEKYGGYNRPTVSFFAFVKFTCGKKTDAMFMSVDLLHSAEFLKGGESAEEYTKSRLEKIIGKPVKNISFPIGTRPIKINTVISLDGFKSTLSGVSNGGKSIIPAPFMMFSAAHEWETYLKRLESMVKDMNEIPHYEYDEKYAKVSVQKNLELYDLYCAKLNETIYAKRCNPPIDVFNNGRDIFNSLDVKKQAVVLLNMHAVFGRVSRGCDLTGIGGFKLSASTSGMSSRISNWKKTYSEAYIIDCSSSGLWEKRSENLLAMI